ncbi:MULTISPECIES: J domain-containing protein [unclassified Sphaerospermopsis]|uniref:DnaJ C-terminal domain-containing protein n=1 Tax=unclassified Sphaerospermopsis TaxID=2646443 RepID=UPI00168179F6|nr:MULTISPECIES: J domain-containing protein [unclassified Sphaerospermopsis]MBD2134544.1 J domain-containing protein [Sphaerospermopsis sp. FACHB-1094]MBD2148005.1 J domain-containing protein [Sphaerospermopsis sp. FACHB-1194]
MQNLQNFRDYYEILGVTKEASSEEIKKVYRRLARQYHPDLNPGDKEAEEKFKTIGEAYEILSDPSRRSQYDQFSRYWKQKGFAGSKQSPKPKGWGDSRTNTRTSQEVDPSEFPDFESFINTVIGVSSRKDTRTNTDSTTTSDPFRTPRTKVAYTVNTPPRTTRRDIEARLTLPLEKAYQGGNERIRLEDGRSLEVTMPPAMVTGQTIRLRNQGIGGGDLYLKITVETHPLFKLEGANIFCQIPVTPSEAVLGGQVEAPTLDGPVKMTIPPAVRSGQRFRLANKGYPVEGGKRGDQLVEIQIVTPKNITTEERELYEKLREIESFKPRADLI